MLVLAPNHTVEKYPYTLGKLRQDNPNTSFPKNPTDQQLADFNVFRVERTEQPSYNEATQKCQELNPTLQSGKWVQVWSIVSLSAEEQTQRTQDRADQIRDERNYKLSATDWTQGKDIADQVSTAWTTYRQALRDLPAQEGFPWNVTWPEIPE